MMRSILAAAALGILAAVPAVYLLSASPRQDSVVTQPGADRAATEARTPIPTVWKSARPRLLWRADKHERKRLPTARFRQELGG